MADDIFEQSDAEIAANRPIEIFQTNTGSKYKIRALSIDSADEWEEKKNAADQLRVHKELLESRQNGDVELAKELREAEKAYIAAMIECVFQYDTESLPEEKIRKEGISLQQISRAFVIMKTVNNPFAIEQAMMLKKQKEMIRGIPIDLLMKGLQNSTGDIPVKR